MSEINENTTEDLNEVLEEEMDDADVITVPIDDTLSNSGEAADAKAVGDALALKADRSELLTNIKVNEQAADNQGQILLNAGDVPMSGTDTTTIKAKIEAVDGKTGSDIPISSESGAGTIASVVGAMQGKTATDIPVEEGSETTVKAALDLLDEKTADDILASDAEGEERSIADVLETLEARTANEIPMSSTDSTTIKATVDAIEDDMVKSVNGEQPDATGDVTIRIVDLAENLNTDQTAQNDGEYIIRTSGGEASIKDGSAILYDIRGNMVKTGYVPESLTLQVNNAERSGSDEPITATIDRDTFVSVVSSSQTITLTYTTGWSADPAIYGITVSGTPISGDSIVVTYVKENRGTITVATPATFASTGWNLYNHSLGYARVIKYSEEYDFVISGTYTSLAFATTTTGTQTAITVVNHHFTIPSDGYVIVTGGNATDTEIWMEWSDWTSAANGGVFEAYTQDTINLSGVMANFPYGLMRVGNVYDEINIYTQRAYSRIERLAYTTENLAAVIAAGLPYDTDTGYIYAVRDAADIVEYIINIDGSYSVSDHGMEIFTGTTVPVIVSSLYGQDLKGKLRRDVLTISQQTLTSAQKAQVITNIGAASGASVQSLSEQIGNFGIVEFWSVNYHNGYSSTGSTPTTVASGTKNLKKGKYLYLLQMPYLQDTGSGEIQVSIGSTTDKNTVTSFNQYTNYLMGIIDIPSDGSYAWSIKIVGIGGTLTASAYNTNRLFAICLQ